jgi:threonine/homoserine/homoserine lactone efflux protein
LTNLFVLAALSFMAALSGALVPGPVFVTVVSESLKKGKKAGPLIVVGHLLIEATIILAILLGLDALLGSPEVYWVVSYVGGAVLILMGLHLARTAKTLKVDMGLNNNAKLASHGLIAAGFLSSGSNPQFFLWWISTGVPMMAITLTSAGTAGFIAFLIGHAAADFLWFSFISYSVDKGRSYLNQKAIRVILFGSALFLMVFGLYLIFSPRLNLK